MAEATQPKERVALPVRAAPIDESRASPGYLELTWRRLRRDHVSMAALFLFVAKIGRAHV